MLAAQTIAQSVKMLSAESSALPVKVLPSEATTQGAPKSDKFAHFDQGGYGVDPRDADTPDNWVPRHPALVRLTGRHPFNVEPPLSMLMESGMITPPAIHIVRDHGAVPRLDWDTHTVSISGAVSNPMTLTMDQIASMPTISFPVTITCAGNRRKEQNTTKQTVGFNWGSAATGCSVWTGVRLRDILLKAGAKLEKNAQYVCFEGADKLPNGFYGTSMTLSHAMDPTMDVIIAFEQNGQKLIPDHGYPVRVIIPGWIGGRSVKWLTKIVVTEKESDNYYHFFDNRILPPQIDKERADKEGWWYKPEYLFNELNINSCISSPAHGEVLNLDLGAKPYAFKGYAYSGGGRKVTRVELSFDSGETWDLCELTHLPSNEHGRNWCWCHWELKVPVHILLSAAGKDIRVRAWDTGNNTQPERLTWNVMGMGNNPHFKVKVHSLQAADSRISGLALWFEHPTIPGPGAGGWMVKPAEESPVGTRPLALKEPPMGRQRWQEALTTNAAYSPLAMGAKDAAAAAPTPAAAVPAAAVAAPAVLHSGTRLIAMSEVERHSTDKDCWIVVSGKVYDATPYLEEHPGGSSSITMNAGTDCTDDFEAIHSDKARKLLQNYYVGDLASEEQAAAAAAARPDAGAADAAAAATRKPVEAEAGAAAAAAGDAAAATTPVALDPRKKISVVLQSKERLSHDTRRFRFALASPQHRFGLPVGNHVFISAKIDGQPCMRAYTPASGDDELGYFDLVIKVYFKNVHPKFPDGGKMSQHLESLAIGDTIEVKGPVGHFTYLGRGKFEVKGKERTTKAFGLICGGTGITPAYQVIKAVLKDPEDTTVCRLLYANQTPDDILLREDLDRWALEHPSRFTVHYTVDRVPDGQPWAFSTGFINEDMIRRSLPAAAGADSFVGMCGPPPMINFACIPNLEKAGYVEDNYMSF